MAPNEKTRKEAEKLIETVENGSSSTVQEQEQEAIETVLDETKRAIKKTVSEDSRREIPKYTEAMAGLQEETIQATKEIGYNSIELQKEAVSLIQFQERFMSYYVPWAYPKLVTEYYSKMVDNFVTMLFQSTNLANSLVIFNIESIQRTTNSTVKSIGGLELRMQRQLTIP